MRTPKTVNEPTGIVIKFSVDGDITRYTSLVWEYQGTKQRKVLEGIFNNNKDEILQKTREYVIENPKEFGYDHDFWASDKELELYAPQLSSQKISEVGKNC